MYETCFHLSHRPFAPAPSADRYVPTASLEQARQTLVRKIERGEGPGLVVGPAGSGKSLLLQVLAQHFRGRFLVALLASSRLCTRRALLQNILFELKLPYREMDEGELRLSLIDHLEPRTGGGDGLLLLVDEAHTLPLRLLEEIRLLTNLVKSGESRVRLVLAGSMALEERLASPKLESFHQRIAARCYLQAMGRDETIYYVQEQIRRSGGVPEAIFTADALRAIHTATDGIPRLVNQVCDHALTLASLGGHKQLGPAGIEEAWADLQQLPVPWHEPPMVAGAADPDSIIEFGQLADDASSQAVAGTIGPRVGEAVLARLDEVAGNVRVLQAESGFAAAEASDESSEFSPAAESGTEVELIFHEAHDPFGSHWDEEEVVIDRYASLEDAPVRNRGRATSDEGKQIGALVAAALEPAPQVVVVTPPLDGNASLEPVPAIAATATFDPASDPLLPEEPAQRPARVQSEFSRRATISLRSIAEDDRDIIVVDEEQPPPATAPPPASRPRRQEYRQLFSSLRNKT
jgi:type II secretory pathway predicted ATPase ExeA